MAYIALKGENRHRLQKRITTVGTDDQHDVIVASDSNGLVFTLMGRESGHELVPAGAKLRINGLSAHRATRLGDCDRIDWSGGSAVYLGSDLPLEREGAAVSAVRSLDILQNLATTLQSAGSFRGAIHQALDALVSLAGAEAGYLLSEIGASSSSWEMVASHHAEGSTSRGDLLSNTILREALGKRDVVYVENTIGHPLSEAVSIIEARIFSAACFPLYVGERTFGAVFLLTRSPGKSVKREALPELRLLATQAMLMLASQAQVVTVRQENQKLRKLVAEWPSELTYDREKSPLMHELDRKIDKLAKTPLGLLILGETGTGKEVVATEIHRRSGRSKGPMVSVNCAAIPGTLLEATLFGYERGAFTGAVKSTRGKFALADGGTLFLDEVGDLPLDLQAKLLRVLQERKVEPLGSEKAVNVDVRIVAATHQELDRAVKEGRFRQDLFFRLNGAVLKIPPLRDRKEDIGLLANHFLSRVERALDLAPEALEALEAHSWPGNVRELEQVITRAALLADGIAITAFDLDLDTIAVQAGPSGILSTLEDAQMAFTREYVGKALELNQGNRLKTAHQLGISERTLYRILSKADGSVSPA